MQKIKINKYSLTWDISGTYSLDNVSWLCDTQDKIHQIYISGFVFTLEYSGRKIGKDSRLWLHNAFQSSHSTLQFANWAI